MNESEQTWPVPFTPAEELALQALRTRYGEDRDHFTETERAQFQFLRWLRESGRLETPSGDVA
jgi:hypothetical protein